jgi:hypothetical protein
MVICPAGPETKNDCAGEGQQKITTPEKCAQSFGRKLEGQRLLETCDTNGRVTLEKVLKKNIMKGYALD